MVNKLPQAILAIAAAVLLVGSAIAAGSDAPSKAPAKVASAPAPASSSAEHAMLTRAANALEKPEDVAGAGWQESAASLIDREKATHGAQLSAVVDGAKGDLSKALADVAQTLNMPSLVPRVEQHQAQQGPKGANSKTNKDLRYRIYVSQAMGEAALRSVMEYAAGRNDTVIVLRGVTKGQKVAEMQIWLGNLVRKQVEAREPLPNIEIDPTLFSEHGVSVVPTLEKLDASGAVVATVRGVTDTSWLDTRIAAGSKGDIGAFGPTVAVSELDLLEAFQQKVKDFDWQAWKEKAASDYWKKAPFTELEKATEYRERTVDPTVVVPQDIVAPNGVVVARQGDKFNPLDSIGFHQTLVIFDATDKAQLAFARKVVKDAAGQKVKLITTSMDRSGGFDGYVQMENDLEHPVYMLNAPVRDTFHIERVPSTVQARGSVFVITEVPVHQGVN